MLKLIAIVGTNSKRSTNRQLLQYMQKHFTDKAEIELVEIKAIPVFNKPADKQVPAEILEIAAKIEEADGVIIGTPEYDHSIPAVLMSALAWLSYGIYPTFEQTNHDYRCFLRYAWFISCPIATSSNLECS
ncbi:NADPH-dependent FMN reductase domain-containing protein [Streptococcus pneumoniae]|nr:NADPH-dependent FMN reductase domain-containing protein [Streptococcus pneumoniae]CWI11982.1 NADPH-dependent FMN reductase domain-containing protein [Streptococcus pneumoniae]